MATLKYVITHTAALKNKSYEQIAAWLNEQPPVDNPQAQGQTPKRLGMLDVFNAIATAAPADLAKAGAIPSWMVDRAELSMQANDRLGMANWLVSIGAVAGLSPESVAALSALLTATEPDPTWTATVPGPARWQAAGLAGPVSAADVQCAAHEAV